MLFEFKNVLVFKGRKYPQKAEQNKDKPKLKKCLFTILEVFFV